MTSTYQSFSLQFEDLLDQADKDGDGNLDYEEFLNMMTSLPRDQDSE